MLRKSSLTSYSLAPTGPPLELTAESTSPTVLTLSWHPPDVSLKNGLITGYEYTCTDIQTEQYTKPQLTTEESTTIAGLTPFTDYFCSVKAATINGTGPAVSIIATTLEQSM